MDILRTAERKAGVEKARREVLDGSASRLIVHADQLWLAGSNQMMVDIPTLLVLVTMALERGMDLQMRLVR